MYSEDPNQNPVSEGQKQEEKTKSVKKAAAKSKKSPKASSAKKQISRTEKTEILKALRDAVKPVTKKKAAPRKRKPAKQINAALKKEIITLLNDTAVIEQSTAKSKDEKTEPGRQISKEEKKEIVRLLSGGYKADDEHDDAGEDEFDFDELNKQELVELFEEIVQEKDIASIKSKVGNINRAFHRLNREEKENALHDFIADGGNKEDFKHVEDPLEQRFRQAFNIYKHNKSLYAEELEKQKVENLQFKNQILEELKELIESEETLKKTYDEFNQLQDRWKEIGMVPAGELNNLWQNYHFLVEMFFDKVRINKELRDLDLKKNLEKKISLCEKAEELLLEKSIIKSFKLLQKYHDEWREIGPVPSENREELWERFKAATSRINARRKEHYKEIQADQEKNYEAKVALCEKVEEMLPTGELNLKEWQKKTNQINELFKVWKTIGRAPKAKNDEIWVRFKSSLDTFFQGKKEFLNKLKEQQTNNLNLKIDLCVRAEAIKDSEDWRKTTSELINLQKDWKKIGPVPRRQSDKIWKRFRVACDHFFNKKSEFYKNIHVVEDENLKTKHELVKEISEFKVTDDKDANMAALKDFQRKWMETGHVPFKEKDKIQKQYRNAIDSLIGKMDVDKAELTKTGYENKIELLKNDPDSDWKVRKERNYLLNKINKIKEDVALWENNIGFFSSSKQSDKLKKEFEEKIEKAKQEIGACEAKIKILNGM